MAISVALIPIFNVTRYTPARAAIAYLDAVGHQDVGRALSLLRAPEPGYLDGLAENILDGAPSLPSRPRVVNTTEVSDDEYAITVAYVQGSTPRETTLTVVRARNRAKVFNNWLVSIERWPVISISATGATVAHINGHPVRTRDVPVLFPVEYTVGFNTRYLQSNLQTANITAPSDQVDVKLDGKPTKALSERVTDIIKEQLDACATSTTLMPTGCGFGFETNNEIIGDVTWKVKSYPTVSLNAGKSGIEMAPANAVFTLTGTSRDAVTGHESTFTETVTSRIKAHVDVDGSKVTVTQFEG